MTLLLGIDDAGRGPVIGPMVLAGVIINENQKQEIKELGVKDSKMLSPSKRRKLSEIIKQKYTYFTIKTEPPEIDSHSNLNWLEAEKCAKIIENLLRNSNEKADIIIDCPSVNCQAWQDYLIQKISSETRKKINTISSEHKADINHPIVSAASIIAKEKRESEMKKIREEIKLNLGSGYPSDPKTKEFLKENFRDEKYKRIIRHSWNTVKNLVNEKQTKLF